MHASPHAPTWSDDVLRQLAHAGPDAGQEAQRLRRAWLAEDGAGTAVGFAVAAAVCIPGAPAECELEFVFVSPAARRMGVGRALLQTVFVWAGTLPAKDVWLEVRASNEQAMALYTHCGFLVVGRRPGYYADPPEDAVLLRRGIGS